MKIRYNEDAEVVARLRAALLKRNLQCPCRLQKTEDNICMCKEFATRSPIPSSRATAIACSTIRKSKAARPKEKHRRKTVLFSFQ